MSNALGFLALLMLPVGYLGFAASLHVGLRRQPHVALARTPQRFRKAVDAAGGVSAVRAGLGLDLVFLIWYGATGAFLLREGRWWWLPIAAALLDLLENAVIAWLLRRERASKGTGALALLAVLKFLLYGASLVALVAAFCVVCRG